MALKIGSGRIPGKSILDTPGKITGTIGDFISNPFSLTPPDTRPVPDFPAGFVITEFVNGSVAENIILKGTWMPKAPFSFGGTQRTSKEFYAGNSEPNVQILGPEEDDLTILGTLRADKLRPKDATSEQLREFRTVSTEMQQQIEAFRIRGNLVRMQMGEWQRYGFITRAKFDLRTLADLDYSITFLVVGFNPPLNCNQIDRKKEVPFDINKKLLSAANDLQDAAIRPPIEVPLSIADLIRGYTSDVLSAVYAVTDFADTTLRTVEDTTAAINRALGTVRFAQAEMSRFQRRLGALSILDFRTGGSTNIGQIIGFDFTASLTSSSWSLASFLAELKAQYASLSETIPLARHRIGANETLQDIAVRYYNDPHLWEEIYDHNNLTSTLLDEGSVLEIPEV